MSKAGRGAGSRAAAAQALHSVLHEGRSLDAALPPLLEDLPDSRDASLARALVYGSLRNHQLHQHLLKRLLNKPLKQKDRVLESLLSVSLFQLLESERPDFAVVSAAVDATRVLGRPHAKGLVNAVLRNFLRRRDELLHAAQEHDEVRLAMPGWLLKKLRHSHPDNWESIVAASNTQAPMWLRVNTGQCSVEEYAALLLDAGIESDPAPFGAGLRLHSPQPVDQLPRFAEGASSVQDIAAQLAALLLEPQAGERILDACAAPGGKACHIAELTKGDALVVALDNSEVRLERVRENAARLKLPLTTVAGDATQPEDWWDDAPFDRMLIDAPCSATGVIRRHPDIPYLRRASDIAELSALQLDILDALWPLLKAGGTAVYATCSVMPEENGAVVGEFLARHSDATLRTHPLLDTYAEPAEHGGYQFLPGNSLDSDGFFYALLAKAAG